MGEAGSDRLFGQNGSDNLDGGEGRDWLFGGNGDDTLRGGAGDSDYLSGDAGSDTYLFAAGFGVDTLDNEDADSASIDRAIFEEASIEELWFSQEGDHLQITVAGTSDQVTISHWFAGDDFQLDEIQAGSAILLNQQVEQLVNAMAVYDVPVGVGNVVPQAAQDALQPTLAEAWQAG